MKGEGEWPRDGMTLKRRRLMDLITYVAQWPHDEKPCSEESIQIFMLLKHGANDDRTTNYIRQLRKARVLEEDPDTGDIHLRMTYEQTLAAFETAGEWGATPNEDSPKKLRRKK